MSWPILLNLLKLSLGSFKFACTLSGVKCGNHDTVVMPQLLMWVTLIKFEKMVEMTVSAAVFRACGVCQDWSVFQTSITATEVGTETLRKDLS